MAEQRDLKLDGRELSASTVIWRYIKLSTLFYLLEKGRSFIPKVATLQKDDPFEGKLNIYEGHQEIRLLEHELLQKQSWFHREAGTLTEWEKKPWMHPSIKNLWMRELTKRRLVWCWHESESECMGQWRIYGKEAGVAIQSDVGSVLRMLGRPDNKRDVLYGRIQYIVPDQPISSEGRSAKDMARNPLFLKNAVFAHEKEVRFLLEDKPWSNPGYTIHTPPCEFVKRVVLSPFFQPVEGYAVRAVINSLFRQVCPLDVKMPEVTISGALNVQHPEGEVEADINEGILENLADEYMSNRSCDGNNEEGDVPATLNLF